uniref:Uncharacterized protein n=1 Tax=Romanomermis culicivorax TaxID=13658 RepID=A0A915HY48_ROMCU
MDIQIEKGDFVDIAPEMSDKFSTTGVASSLEFLNIMLKDCQPTNISDNLKSKITDLEAVIINQNTKIKELNFQKQQLTSSIAEMGKNYATLQKDNQMWKQQCKSLVDARVKFENEEVNVLRSAYADKLKESSELYLELTTCQNQLETTKQALQITNDYKNILLNEKQNLEQRSHEATENFEKALRVAQNLNNKCKAFEDSAKRLEQELIRFKEKKEPLPSSLNSRAQFWMDSYSKLAEEKEELLHELNSIKYKNEKELLSRWERYREIKDKSRNTCQHSESNHRLKLKLDCLYMHAE